MKSNQLTIKVVKHNNNYIVSCELGYYTCKNVVELQKRIAMLTK